MISDNQYRDAVQPDTHDTSRGPCGLTYTGRWLYYLDPRPEEITVLDIAQALSQQCRYNGMCHGFYSIAEHSLHCLEVARDIGYDLGIQRQALMHDAAEAYVSDLPRPVKLALPEYYEHEARIQAAISDKYGFEAEMDNVVRMIDNRMLHTESPALGVFFNMTWGGEDEGPLSGADIQCYDPPTARRKFLQAFTELFDFNPSDVWNGRV